ncbi:5-formyltetrahydrofolate cyclo-ligase [Cohnella luojiensis]|uniref:5-formyltetrahydrofolate cyclo-ligase n=2 Tax=Cohnella luojiensis TaxID=652876 RepID=A0A4Y8M4I6_9BACL|nr:5-formyltetrahydrofolate cyclo-ligase [Cohnella luojiensis]
MLTMAYGDRQGNIGKPERRRRFMAARDSIPSAERESRSIQLCDRLETEVLSELRKRLNRPMNLCVFAPFRSEASPVPLLLRCWEMGDQTYAPSIVPGEEGMELRKVEQLTDWIPGKWGVPEPDPVRAVLIESTQPIDAVIVPGLAYDVTGGRLGYGGGYYDRLYEDMLRRGNAETLWIGFAFDAQVAAEPLPVESHDLRLNVLATEARVIWFNDQKA